MDAFVSLLILAIVVAIIALILWLIVRAMIGAFMPDGPTKAKVIVLAGALIALLALLYVLQRAHI